MKTPQGIIGLVKGGVFRPVPGSKLRVCYRCLRDTWFAPSGIRKIAELKLKPVCDECALYLVADGSITELQHPSRADLMEDVVVGNRN